MEYRFTPHGVCSQEMIVVIEDGITKDKPVVHGMDDAVRNDAVLKDADIEYKAKINNKNLDSNDDAKEQDVLESVGGSLKSAKAAVSAFMAPRKKREQYDNEGNVVEDVPKVEESKSNKRESFEDVANKSKELSNDPESTNKMDISKKMEMLEENVKDMAGDVSALNETPEENIKPSVNTQPSKIDNAVSKSNDVPD